MTTEAQELNDNKPEIEKKPNENGGFQFSSFLQITDPETKEVILKMRGDI